MPSSAWALTAFQLDRNRCPGRRQAVLAEIARLMLTDSSSSRSLTYLAAALFSSFAGNIWSTTTHQDGPASVQPTVVMLGYVLFAAGIAHPSMEAFTSIGAGSRPAPRGRRVWLMALGQAMPALALSRSAAWS